MKELYFDIRNGDVSILWDDNGDFLEGSVIKCGEWDIYNRNEEDEFMELMEHWKLTNYITRKKGELYA